MNAEKLVSVVFPTRARPDALRRSVESLLGTANRPDRVEILIAVDPDDQLPPELPCVSAYVVPERWGYPGLHRYYNYLATRSTAEWLLLWNDDAAMETEGWDSIVESQSPALLWAYCPEEVGDDVFPFVPAAWARHLGHMGLTFCVNAWLHEVAEMLPGRIHHIPVQLHHVRINDITHQVAEAIPHEPRNLHNTEPMHQAKREDAAKLRAFLGDEFGNTELVSVLLPGAGSPGVTRQLLDTADQSDEVEFLIAGGRYHRQLRTDLENAGVMGHAECHVSETTAGIRHWCHGRWVRELGSFVEGSGWDSKIREDIN